MRIAFVSSAVPRRCGIATFTSDLAAGVRSADPAVRVQFAALDEPFAARTYSADVAWRIAQEEPASYAAAARAIGRSTVDVVNLQHEFGLYGVWHDGLYDDHLRVFLDACGKPVVTTLHTVPPRPEPWALTTIRDAADRSAAIVVMSATGAQLLREVYGISKDPIVIEHGMPVIQPRGRRRLKRALAMEDRSVISTFGLVDPRKGLEYVVEALPEIVARHPRVLYLVIGQTHPELLKREGESYRNSIIDAARRAGVTEHLRFVNEYLTQAEIVEYLLASDVYVTPYLDPGQITSGTLAYALGAGKAIVSTPYLHASEVLADDRGVLVPFRDAAAIAAAVGGILEEPLRKQRLEERAYAYGRRTTWPAIGAQVLALMRQVAAPRHATLLPEPALVA
ncbi:MAG TPA: glycosyltransferase family 4 protein [Candidatus Limnocylindria bacterium]|jgi:glycosyltransferase involved in cell wall biosynthesis|nr:glycosyltransferase family 4 protein [Candidatus Limnocylindria bacterium]